MKALQFDAIGNLAALKLVDLPLPIAAADEVLIKVQAAGLNPSDVKNVLGRFPYTTLPRTPGRDFAGTVVKGPSQWLGRAVWGTGRGLGFTRDGSHAEYLVLPIAGLAHKPPCLSFAQAASCGVPYTTAWDALQRSGVSAGTTLCIIGANGAVGQAAVQLARARGAHIVAAVRKPQHAAELTASGIATLILNNGADLARDLRAHFAAGAEVIFDTSGFWLEHAIGALADFGRMAVIAAPLDGHVRLPVLDLYRRGGSVIGVNSLLYDVQTCANMLTQIGALFDSAQLPPPQVQQQAAFADAVSSYARVAEGAAGKIVFVMNEDPA